MQAKKPKVENEFVRKIIEGSGPLTKTDIDSLMHGEESKSPMKQHAEERETELRFSHFVMEIEILPKVS